MNISQSLIKEVLDPNHCPRQIYMSFIEGHELKEASENMILGRYFESELLGSCRGGEKQPPKLIKGGEKASKYREVDEVVIFARGVFKSLGIIPIEAQKSIIANGLSAAIDLVANDIEGEQIANYDVKYTETKEDDKWNGWGSPEYKEDAIIQAAHYSLVTFESTGKWIPFYFLVFGSKKWVKVLRYRFDETSIEIHKKRIANTAATIKEYAMNNYKGVGKFNKCISCPFFKECPDASKKPEIEQIFITQ